MREMYYFKDRLYDKPSKFGAPIWHNPRLQGLDILSEWWLMDAKVQSCSAICGNPKGDGAYARPPWLGG